MNKLTTVIVDDEPDSISTLQNFLTRYCSNVQVLGTASSVDDAQKKLSLYNPQLVFLDINMPGGGGFELLKRIGNADFQVVFVTAYDNFALEAFKHHALNYLLKPVNIDDLIESVQRAEKSIHSAHRDDSIAQSIQSLAINALPNKIALPSLNGLAYIEIASIIRCEAKSNYTIFHFINRPKMVVSRTLGTFEMQLSLHGFFRIHNQHLINLAHLDYYQRGRGGTVVMSDKKEITVAQRKRDEFLKLLELG